MARLVAGVDVGARRKGFHAVVIEGDRVVEGPRAHPDASETVAWLVSHRPGCVAVDSPRRPAADGERSREDERLFAQLRICGIRWTPDRVTIDGSVMGYYDWIQNGFRLYDELERARKDTGWELIECFPTATWTVRFGPRAGRRRAAWTRQGLEQFDLSGLPARRLNQDDRDAIAAALTADLWSSRPRQAGRIGRDLVIPHALNPEC